MCIVSGPVANVNTTKLFAARSANGKRQLTVYSNKVSTHIANNIMILAVPNPTTIKFHDLTNYAKLFTDLENSFPKSRSFSLEGDMYLSKGEGRLKVHEVGSYQASIANNLNDLNRLDRSLFYVDDEVIMFLTNTYKSYANIGFVICRLKQGNHEYHPFAYSHDIHSSNKLFIPTKHYHKTSSFEGSFGLFGDFMPITSNSHDMISDDWDHEIYVMNDKITRVANDLKGTARTTSHLAIDKSKIDFELEPFKELSKLRLEGNHLNTDILVI
jgi:hypothetical protein